MSRQRSRVASSETETVEESSREDDEQPEMMHSQQRLRDHQPDAYTTGYDASGSTRVGIGTANGNIERLVRMNEGRHRADGDLSKYEAARDKKRITESLCSALDVTSFQQQEAISVMGQLNLDQFGQQKRIEKVALCAIKVIVERDREQWFLNGREPEELDLSSVDIDHFPKKLSQDQLFRSLCEKCGLSDKDRYSISQLVKRELKRIGYFERAEQPI